MPGARLDRRLLSALILLAAGAVLAWPPATSFARSGGGATLTIGTIKAVFDSKQKETTYSVPSVVDDIQGAKCCDYAWTLTIAGKAAQVDPAFGLDPGCNNHGVSGGTAATFTWEHGNKGEARDDGCNHAVYGKYGHQGLITVTVSDDKGWECTATYKGTLSNDENATLNQQPAGTPVCNGPPNLPRTPAPCKCLRLTARIVPSSVKLEHPNDLEETHLVFTVHWVLGCTGGAGRCEGTIRFPLIPYATYVDSAKNRRTVYFHVNGKSGRYKIHCESSCGKVTDGGLEVSYDSVYLKGQYGIYGPMQRSQEVVPINLYRVCYAGEANGKELPPLHLAIAFDIDGNVDLAKSTLR